MSDDDADDNLDVNAAGNEYNSGNNNNERLLTVAEDPSDNRHSASMEFDGSASQLITSRHRSKTLPPEDPKQKFTGPAPNRLENSNKHTGTNGSSDHSMSDDDEEE